MKFLLQGIDSMSNEKSIRRAEQEAAAETAVGKVVEELKQKGHRTLSGQERMSLFVALMFIFRTVDFVFSRTFLLGSTFIIGTILVLMAVYINN